MGTTRTRRRRREQIAERIEQLHDREQQLYMVARGPEQLQRPLRGHRLHRATADADDS